MFLKQSCSFSLNADRAPQLKRCVRRFLVSESMAREIKESDWKVFRRLSQVALERFCRRVIEELGDAASKCDANYHECYLNIFKLLRHRDKELGRAFDDPRRSSAFILLANICEMGLLTEEELMQFSPEMRESLDVIDRIRRT